MGGVNFLPGDYLIWKQLVTQPFLPILPTPLHVRFFNRQEKDIPVADDVHRRQWGTEVLRANGEKSGQGWR